MYLVFQCTVLSFRLFADNDEINILVAKFEARDCFYSNNVGIQIQGSSRIDLQRGSRRLFDALPDLHVQRHQITAFTDRRGLERSSGCRTISPVRTLTVRMPFIPTRFRLNEETMSAKDDDRPGINSLQRTRNRLVLLRR